MAGRAVLVLARLARDMGRTGETGLRGYMPAWRACALAAGVDEYDALAGAVLAPIWDGSPGGVGLTFAAAADVWASTKSCSASAMASSWSSQPGAGARRRGVVDAKGGLK